MKPVERIFSPYFNISSLYALLILTMAAVTAGFADVSCYAVDSQPAGVFFQS